MRAKADRVLTNKTRPRPPLLVLAGEEQLTRLWIRVGRRRSKTV
jgi:hypothetical protein